MLQEILFCAGVILIAIGVKYLIGICIKQYIENSESKHGRF